MYRRFENAETVRPGRLTKKSREGFGFVDLTHANDTQLDFASRDDVFVVEGSRASSSRELPT